MAQVSNINLKRKKQKNDQELLLSQYTVKMIPKQVLKPSGIFLLKGNLFFDLNPDTQSRVSSMNYFKQISSSTIHRDIGLLYRTVQTQITQFDSCEKVAYLMKRSNYLELHKFADLLKGHDTLQRVIDEIKQRMKVIAQSNQQIRMVIDQKRKQFDTLRTEKINDLSKNKRFFLFFDFAFDYEGMQLNMIGNGLSETWIRLMGCDIQAMQGMSMRKGIISFFEGNTKWNLFRTLDDILINTTFTTHSLFCKSGQAFEGYFHPEYSKQLVDRKTIFFEIHISDYHINTINRIRQQQNNNLNAYDNDFQGMQIESNLIQPQTDEHSQVHVITKSTSNLVKNLLEDIPYSVQSEDFVQRFYGMDVIEEIKANLLPTKECGFKCI